MSDEQTTLFDVSEPPGSRSDIIPRYYQTADHDRTFELFDSGTRGVLTRGFTGSGKCLGEGTPVMLSDGTIAPVESIKTGDCLMGPDGKPRHVLSTTTGHGPLYLIRPTKGEPFVVNDVHMLTLKATGLGKMDGIYGIHTGDILDIPLDEYLRKPRHFKHIMKGFRVAINFPDHGYAPPVDPYFLGVWLGDGADYLAKHHSRLEITTADQEIVAHLEQVAYHFGLFLHKRHAGGKSSTYRLVRYQPGQCRTSRHDPTFHRSENGLLTAMQTFVGTKVIPHWYKTASRSVRLQLLAGLMDTDGSLSNGGFDYISSRQQLANDVAFIARSLGLAAYVKSCSKTCCNNGVCGIYWRLTISGDCSVIPTRIPRKQAPPRRQKKDVLSFGFSVESIGDGTYYGFTLDRDGRFLLGDFTVTHNTLQTCLKIDTWLQRSPDHRAMVLSYEHELVNQFTAEVWDYLGKHAAVEMGEQRVDYDNMPQIVVASRASLLCWPEPTKEHRAELATYNITDTGCTADRHVVKYLKLLKAQRATPEEVRDEIARVSMEPEAKNGRWSRVHRFTPEYNWLLCFDEAHKHAYHLRTVGPLIDWFSQNPETRWTGVTATPKRGDGVSIGHKMFPGIALDLPLYKPDAPCGVSDGWAVPYIQRYIEVEGVDFRSINRIGKDFDPADLERVLGAEEKIAKLVEPVLHMVGDRPTLIFSPGVQMAKDVAHYINARSRCVCTCGHTQWTPTLLLGDGSQCSLCGRALETGDIDKSGDQARQLDGTIPARDRGPVYEDHKAGKFQFLSICGLCREGYNDPNISCVVIFRPVSRAASSLAEQMKGRGCRPLRGLLNQWPHEYQREQRLEAIRTSNKPDCLIIDLVGVTGLADCASTIQIYAEGLPDEVAQMAEAILLGKGKDCSTDVEAAIQQAKREHAEAKAKAKAEREAAEQHAKELAERRAKAGAEVNYTTHEKGVGAQIKTNEASEKQYKMVEFLGMDIQNTMLTKAQMGRIIRQLQEGVPPDEVARTNRIEEHNWSAVGPTHKQKWALRGIHADWVKTRADASLLLSAHKNQAAFFAEMRSAINRCESADTLTRIARNLGRVNRTVRLDQSQYAALIVAGREKRSTLTPTEF